MVATYSVVGKISRLLGLESEFRQVITILEGQSPVGLLGEF